MSDTPETDAAEHDIDEIPAFPFVSSNFAQRLECERDEARKIAACSRCDRLALRVAHLSEALEAADERLALIEDVGHGAHVDNVTVARGIIAKAMSLDPANV